MMKRYLKAFLWTVLGVLTLTVLLHAWYLRWTIDAMPEEGAGDVPRYWSSGPNWRARVEVAGDGAWRLSDCRIGSLENAWFFADAARFNASNRILYCENAVWNPAAMRQLADWLKEIPLPVAGLSGNCTVDGRPGQFSADAATGVWRFSRQEGEVGEVLEFDAVFERRDGTAEQLPAGIAALVAACPAPVVFEPGNLVYRLRRRLADGALELAEAVGGCEYFWSPAGWRLTERDLVVPAIPELEFRRFTRAGSPDAPDSIRLSGEVLTVRDAALGRWFPDAMVSQGVFGGVVEGGVWSWRLSGRGGGSPLAGERFSAAAGAWSLVRDGAGVRPELTLNDVALRNAGNMVFAIPELTLTGWNGGRWAWRADRAAVAAWGGAAWEIAAPAGELSLEGWRLAAPRAECRVADPELTLRFDELEAGVEGWSAASGGVFGVEWELLWSRPGWDARNHGAIGGGRLELRTPEGSGSARTAVLLPGSDGGLGLRVNDWEWEMPGIGRLAGPSVSMAGVWRDGCWRGKLRGEGASAELAGSRISASEITFALPCEFPGPAWRPRPEARPDPATGLYREAAGNDAGTVNAGTVRYDALLLGSAAASVAAGEWQGRLALADLDGAELYWSRREGRWGWLLPPADWRRQRQLGTLFPAWHRVELTGTLGMEFAEGGCDLLLRGAGVRAGGLDWEGVIGNWPLAVWDAPESRVPARWEFARFGPWSSGSLTWNWRGDGAIEIAELTGKWRGAVLTLAEPVSCRPGDGLTVWRAGVAGLPASELFAWYGLPADAALQTLRLDGSGEWWHAPEHGWTLAGLELAAGEVATLALPVLAKSLRGEGDSVEFCRRFLGSFRCRRLEFSLVPGADGGATLTVGVAGSPSEPLPYAFTGESGAPWAAAREGEPGFGGEISFDFSLKIPPGRYILSEP